MYRFSAIITKETLEIGEVGKLTKKIPMTKVPGKLIKELGWKSDFVFSSRSLTLLPDSDMYFWYKSQ